MATRLNRRSPRAGKSTNRILTIAAVIAALVILVPMLVGLYTDYLWFGEVGYRSVFGRVLATRLALFVIFGLLGAAISFAAAYFAWRGRDPLPNTAVLADPDSPAAQYRASVQQSVRGMLVWVPVLVGLLAGVIGQSGWRTFLLWINSEPFGSADAQFGRDLSFYAFTLPALSAIVSMLSMLLVFAFFIGMVGHYLLGGIVLGNQIKGSEGHISQTARVQLAVTAGLWMLVKAVDYWFQRYTLMYNSNEVFTGASYTDINAQLPAKIILLVIAVIVAAAFFASIVYKDMRVPALAAVLMLGSALVIGQGWPLLIEQFSVKPNRAAKESEYIGRNIEATREAFGLTDNKITYERNWGADAPEDAEVGNDVSTISNIRLLDPEIISPTFTQKQQLKNFYGFPGTLAMDRYTVDGELRDFVVAAREVNPNALADNQLDWINRHTVYTHGNGFIAAQANIVDEAAQDAGSTRGGLPVFTLSGIQSKDNPEATKRAEELGIAVDQPRVYFGPVIASAQDGMDYAIVGDIGQGDVEYDTESTKYTYTGSGGVDIGNWINRTAYAVKYQEINLLLSDRVGGNSKILYDRDPRQRVEKVAPWLTTDSKTYPTVVDGRIKWVVDGYTTLSELPYASRASLSDTTQDALNPEGTNQRLVNNDVAYIRNSVKATVDAYDGTVELYAFDESDPVLKAWMGAFPGTVKPASEISDELRQHLRYPEDLFKVQRALLARYHVSNPGVFFNNDAFWSVPNDPTAAEGRQELNQPPYYIVAADPETGKPSFQLISPYRGLNREFLSAHMSVTSDPDNYGNITVRVLPTNTQTDGPKQAQDALMSSDQVARDRTLWTGSNTLKNGNLLTLPVADGEILYIEPIYSQRKDQESAYPKLLRVLVYYKKRVGYAPTLSQALEQVGIDSKAAQEIEGEGGDGEAEEQTPPEGEGADAEGQREGQGEERQQQAAPAPAAPGDEREAIKRIDDALSNLEAKRDASFEEYGKALDELDKAVEEYQKLQK